MKLKELDIGEKFKFNNDIWTKKECVQTYNSDSGTKRQVFSCMNSEGRHRPFNDNTEVDPLQTRLQM